jgi:serine/threonine protein kinase
MSVLAQLRELNWDHGHVRVTMKTLSTGDRVYVKQFKKHATEGAGKPMPFAEYWPERENSLLTRLREANVEHAVRVEAVSRGENTISTYDAGISLNNLIQFSVQFADETKISPHPFFNITEFLKLLKGIIVALNEVHRANIIHADLNAGNICAKVEEDETGQYCYIDYSQIQLIDFAFSLSRDLRLTHILPIDTKKATYMAPLYRNALERDFQVAENRNWQGGCENVEREMHQYMDFYSLGVLADDLYDRGVRTSNGIRVSQLEEIINDLKKFFDAGKPGVSDQLQMLIKGRPEKRILSRIERLLARSGNVSMQSGRFRLASGTERAAGEHGQDTPSIAGKTAIKAGITPPRYGGQHDAQGKEGAGYTQSSQSKGSPSAPQEEGRPDTKKGLVLAVAVALALLIGGGGWFADQLDILPFLRKSGGPPPIEKVQSSVPPVKKNPDAPSVESLRRTLEAGTPWPNEFTELLRQHDQNSELAYELVRDYEKILNSEDKSSDANARQRQAWRILESLSGLDDVNGFSIPALDALLQYSYSTEQLSQKLQDMLKDPKRQAKEQRWPGYEQRLNLQADMGDARSSLLLGVIMAAQGKTVPAFHRLLEAAGSKDTVVQKAGLESLPNFLESVLQSQDKQSARDMLPELNELMRKGADPNWQIWLNRMKEAIGEK